MSQSFSEFTLHPHLPKEAFTEEELTDLQETCNLKYDVAEDGRLSFYAEEYYFEQEHRWLDEPVNGSHNGPLVNMVSIFQAALSRLSDGEYPAIYICGAWHADRMRAGEFGGFAYWIKRDSHDFFSTHEWLREKAKACGIIDPEIPTKVIPPYLPNDIL